MNYLFTRVAGIFLAASLCACGGRASVFGDSYEVSEISQGITPGDAFAERLCQGFFMPEKNIKSFLQRAKPINSSELHYGYDWAPCYVAAKLVSKDRVVNVEIRASGVASVRFIDGEQISLGCGEECDDLLRDKK